MRVLVVDDLGYNIRTLRAVFQSAGYEVDTAADGQAALDAVRARRPDFVVTDVLMPRVDGFQLCRAIKTDPALASIPVIFYTGSYAEPADREFGSGLGAAAYLLKPMEPRELLAAVATALGQPAPALKPHARPQVEFTAAYADRLAAKLQDKIAELNRALEQQEETCTGIVAALTLALARREGTDPRETEWAAQLALLFCERVAPELAADPNVYRGFLLHDVGKLMLPEGLLTKPGALTLEDRQEFMRQPAIAAEILDSVPGLGRALEIVRHHHEHYDGTGHPDGLKGEAIPMGARIFAMCNTFSAMTSVRPYRQSLGPEQAFAELRRGAGTLYDPSLVEPFITMVQAMVGPKG
ncbi:MAG TPA: HD domain-containing phosphohydrolase [Gemmatimonadales bacterium]|nr:HD domain-containing phosphohydrolase [Gemmatimonadales bacterium]